MTRIVRVSFASPVTPLATTMRPTKGISLRFASVVYSPVMT